MKITDLSPDNRPRERLEKEGPQALSSSELLAIILKSGTKKENVLDISNRLISKYGLDKLPSCSLQQLQQQYGIGRAKACQILAIFALHNRVNQAQQDKHAIRTSKDIATIYVPKYQNKKKEQFVSIYLDTKNRIIRDETVTVGTLDSSLVHPREVFHGAIKHLAHSIIVLHNHPSGDPQPSKEDLYVTKKLQKTAQVVGITLLDHIIIGKQSWWSWKEGKVGRLET